MTGSKGVTPEVVVQVEVKDGSSEVGSRYPEREKLARHLADNYLKSSHHTE